jgi:hypothetical protein
VNVFSGFPVDFFVEPFVARRDGRVKYLSSILVLFGLDLVRRLVRFERRGRAIVGAF